MSAAAPPPPGPGAGAQGPPEVRPEDLFVVAEVGPRRVYENEPVVVRYRLFTRVDVSSYGVTQTAGNEGFWVEDVPQAQNPAVEQVVRDGVPYATTVLRQSVLFPTGPGPKTVEPLTVEARVRTRRRSLSLFDDFFDRSSLFGSVVPVVVASEPVDVEVLPLPAAGRPESFTGLVGRLRASASLDRSEVRTNEAVTLSLSVSGEGNLRALQAPDLDLGSEFEVFPPEISESIDRQGTTIGGTRTYEYVLIPRTPGPKTVPPIEMAYFDVEEERYVTSSTAPLALAVTGDAIVVAPGVRAGVETLREDIRFIQIAPPRLVAADGSLFDTAGFWTVTLLPLLALLSAAVVRWHRERLEGDVAYARGRRAGRVARRRLAEARSLISDDDVRGFYTEVERALRGFLADKLNVAEAGLMSQTAESALLGRGVAAEAVGEYLECLGACDRARFAPPGRPWRGTRRVPRPGGTGDGRRAGGAVVRVALVLAFLAGLAPGAAAPLQLEFYQEGNRLYQEGDFEGALSSYLRVVEAGFESGEVYYNIGNAYFKVGDLARAILYYERARRLRPGDEDVLANLDLARSLTVDEIEPLPTFWVLELWGWWVALLPRSLLDPAGGGGLRLDRRRGDRARRDEGEALGCLGRARGAGGRCGPGAPGPEPRGSGVRHRPARGGRGPRAPGERVERAGRGRGPHDLHRARRHQGPGGPPGRRVGRGGSGGRPGRVGPGRGDRGDLGSRDRIASRPRAAQSAGPGPLRPMLRPRGPARDVVFPAGAAGP